MLAIVLGCSRTGWVIWARKNAGLRNSSHAFAAKRDSVMTFQSAKKIGCTGSPGSISCAAASLFSAPRAGASLINFDGEIERSCEQYLAANPGASYEECKKALFERLDWRNTLRTVSPRTFEAAACGNVMVMHEGEYAGILCPDVHYIAIRKDYSNLPEVLARMRDERFCLGLRENGYRDLIASGRFRYRTFIEDVDKILDRVENDPARGHKRCSRIGFYLSGYLKHGQTAIPLGDRCLSPPSWGRCFRLFWLCQELLKQPALLVCVPLLCWVVLHGLVRKVRKRIRRRHGRGLACPSPSANLLQASTTSQQGHCLSRQSRSSHRQRGVCYLVYCTTVTMD